VHIFQEGEKIEQLWNEWIDFKERKIKEWGIKRPIALLHFLGVKKSQSYRFGKKLLLSYCLIVYS